MLLLETAIALASYVIGIGAALHALLKAREPRSALIWSAVCLFIPFFGALLYAVFGVNRVKKMTQNWRSHGFSHFLSDKPEKHSLSSYGLTPEFRSLIQSGDQLLQSHIRPGCKIEPLFDGQDTYPAMLAAIESATDSIFLMTYIFSPKGMGEQIIQALAAAVARKVEVKVLIDGIGDFYSKPSAYKLLKKHRVPVQLFLSPLHSVRGFLFLNMRNHAKIMVVDGKVGFTGGMNIRDEGKLHDLHFRCEGPIVGPLQDVFLNLWYFAKRETEGSRVLFYDDTAKGQALARGIDNGPYQDFPHIVMRLMQAINAAKSHIRIMTPYFVVGNVLIADLISARLRGIDVEVILPEENNLSFVKGATEAILPTLLRYGVKFYYRQGPFAHSKLVIVDDVYVCLGSANLDTRSFLLNFEFNLEVFDRALASKLIEHFEEIKAKQARAITVDWLQKRSIFVKLRNGVCKLFAPYL